MARLKVGRSNRNAPLLFALAILCLVPGAAWAQQASGIAGVVRDSAGLTMPGVSVEAASPALIEKVRSTVTDGEGRYRIIDLVTGPYTVTFTLPGFSGQTQQKITTTFNWESDGGTLIAYKGAKP